ncbi:MAG: ABC transporter ATP-binding protein/permease [Gemmatales bacterium]|nr:ABC transporter ATP-binding protein/permease [Gemmatales bacterium]MDW8387782.1 ABC transporter ATP-binding protein [Gemmatales bacterium]
MASEGFLRARRFLDYSPVASWGAMAVSVAIGLLQILLLALLGLFLDLVIHGGSVRQFGPEDAAWLAERFGSTTAEQVESALRDGRGVGLVSPALRLHRAGHPLTELFAGPASWFAWTRSNGTFLTGLLILSAVLAIAHALLVLLMHHLAASAVVEAATRLRRAVYHQTYRLGTLAFRALGTSEAIGIFTRYLEAVIEGLYVWLTVTLRAPATIALLLAFALAVEWGASGAPPWLTVAFLLFALLFWLVEGQLAAYFRREEHRNSLQASEQLALLQESLQILRLVKCYLMELFNQARVERQLALYARRLRERYLQRALFGQTLALLAILALALLLYGAGWNILSGNLGVAPTLTVLATLGCLYVPIWTWFEQQRTLRRAKAAADTVFAFLDRRGDVGQIVGAEFLPPLSRKLEFRNVTLREPGTGRTLLEDVSLEIRAKERVALVGQDELEKHALVYLIPRFLDPREGEVLIDGKDLRWVTLESLRVQVALVLQHNLVFNDTVANNIGGGDPAYTLPQIMEAAKVAHAHQFIQKLPQGYDTLIGDLGHSLSVSEQFRIALARAILRDPALVIIEEPTQPLDDDTKAMLDDTYHRFLPDRTTIFLPHRLSTIKSCNRIFLLHKGRIEAVGSHRDLLAQSELYRHLQYLEFNVFHES